MMLLKTSPRVLKSFRMKTCLSPRFFDDKSFSRTLFTSSPTPNTYTSENMHAKVLKYPQTTPIAMFLVYISRGLVTEPQQTVTLLLAVVTNTLAPYPHPVSICKAQHCDTQQRLIRVILGRVAVTQQIPDFYHSFLRFLPGVGETCRQENKGIGGACLTVFSLVGASQYHRWRWRWRSESH